MLFLHFLVYFPATAENKHSLVGGYDTYAFFFLFRRREFFYFYLSRTSYIYFFPPNAIRARAYRRTTAFGKNTRPRPKIRTRTRASDGASLVAQQYHAQKHQLTTSCERNEKALLGSTRTRHNYLLYAEKQKEQTTYFFFSTTRKE